jgi:NAD(P)-dependent dehydrogenase (short-subunit alcohol dehydrogenase family)
MKAALSTGDGDGWSVLVAIGDVYRKGSYPSFLPDEDAAEECYKAAAMCPDGQVAGLAQAKYIETRTEHISVEDRAGRSLPRRYAEEACRVARVFISTSTTFSKPRARPAPPEAPEARPAPEAPPASTAIASDGQNVHDHSVVQALRRNIRRLMTPAADVVTGVARGDVKDEVRRAIRSTALAEGDKRHALEVLEDLGTSVHSGLGVSEVGVLKTVWDKVQRSSRREDLVEMLARQLASGVEDGHVVCSTGKMARIMGAFEGVLPPEESGLESARPMWAIKEELASLAAKVPSPGQAVYSGAKMAVWGYFASLAAEVADT